MCGLFEVKDNKDKVIYSINTINTTCLLSTCCNRQTEFDILLNKSGKKVGGIAKQRHVQEREAARDADRFFITFPRNCFSHMKAVLMGALFLLDFLFFED